MTESHNKLQDDKCTNSMPRLPLSKQTVTVTFIEGDKMPDKCTSTVKLSKRLKMLTPTTNAKWAIDLWKDVEALEAENASLTEKVEQMKPYVRHKPTCSIYIKWSLGCDCGFNALLGE